MTTETATVIHVYGQTEQAKRANALGDVQDSLAEAVAALDKARNILFAMPNTEGLLDTARRALFDISLETGRIRHFIEKAD